MSTTSLPQNQPLRWQHRMALYAHRGVAQLGPLVVAGAMVWGSMVWGNRLLQSRVWFIHQVEMSEMEHVTRAELFTAAGLDRPRHRLLLDEGTLEEALEAVPWVRDAHVEVGLDGVVRIDLDEAEAAAYVLLGAPAALTLIDTFGDPIRAWDPSQSLDLPIFEGVELAKSGEVDEEDFQRCRSLFAAWEVWAARGLPQMRLVSYDPSHGFQVELADGLRVRLGQDRIPQRLERLETIVAQLRARDMQAREVVLDGDDLRRVPVRLEDGQLGTLDL